MLLIPLAAADAAQCPEAPAVGALQTPTAAQAHCTCRTHTLHVRAVVKARPLTEGGVNGIL